MLDLGNITVTTKTRTLFSLCYKTETFTYLVSLRLERLLATLQAPSPNTRSVTITDNLRHRTGHFTKNCASEARRFIFLYLFQIMGKVCKITELLLLIISIWCNHKRAIRTKIQMFPFPSPIQNIVTYLPPYHSKFGEREIRTCFGLIFLLSFFSVQR